MQLQNAERKRAKIKMALQGPSGSGKTYGALLIAYGLLPLTTPNGISTLYKAM